MADAFRGLTIRLGADARPLSSAINSIAASAGVAQQQMNRLNKALKFNPGNTKALASMVDLAGDKAMHSARQVQTLRTALDQTAAASRELLKGTRWQSWKGGIESIAASYTDIYSRTQKLRAEGTHLTAELQHVYDAAKRAASVDMGISWKKADKYVKGLQRNLSMGGAAAERAKAKLVDLFSKVDANDGVFKMFNVAAGDVQALTDKFFALRSAFKQTDAELKGLQKVEGFRAIQSQVIAATAELREAANEAARLKTQLYAFGGSEGFAKAVMEARRLDEVMEKAIADAQEMKAAFKMLPNSMDAARAKAKSLADAEDAIRQKLIAARDAMAAISSVEGFDRIKAETVNAAVAVQKLEGEYAELVEKEKVARATAESLTDTLKEIRSLTFDNPRASVEDLREAFKLVGITAKEALEDPIAYLNKLESESGQASESLKRVESAMNKVEGEMREMGSYKTFQELNQDAIKLKSTLASINFNKSLFSKLGGIGQTFRQFGYGMYSTLTPALMMAGRYVIQAADDIDAAYRDMRKTVNGTEEQFEHLKDAAVEFSRSHVTTADQILEIEAIGGQLGIAATDLEAFATTVSNLDIATNMDTEDIALSLAKLSNIMHFGQEEYDNFADSLVRLGNNEPALESDIMKIATRFAGMAANVGMGTADMLAFATAATATGQKAEAAGGSMQRTIGRIEKAVASGGDSLEAFAQVSGMSAGQFERTWKDVENHGPARALQAFINGLKNVHDGGGSVTKTLSDLGITAVRDIQLLEGLSNTTDVLADSMEMANDAWNGMSTTMKDGSIEQAGDAAREAGRKSEGFSGELAKMKNNAAALAIELGEGALPYIKQLGSLFKEATGWFKDLSPEIKTTIIGFGGLAAAAGPLAVGIGTAMSAVGHFYGVLGSAGRGMTTLADKVGVLGPAFTKAEKARNLFARGLNLLGTPKALLGIAAAGVVIGILGDKIMKEKERLDRIKQSQEQLISVTEKLRDANLQLKRGFDGVIDSTDEFTYKAGAFRQGVDEMATKGLELYDTINNKLNDALGNANLVQSYSNTISSLAGHCNGSREKLEELKQAIEKYNELTGSSITITDDFSGSINLSTDALNANTAAFQANTVAKAYGEVLADAQKHLAEVSVEIAKNETAIDQATQKLAENGITIEQAMDAWNGQGFDESKAVQLDQMFGGTGWRDLVMQITECGGALQDLEKEQAAAGDVVTQTMDLYTDAVRNAAMEAKKAQEEVEKQGKASTYYEALGEKGQKAFAKIREQAGFAKDQNDQFAQALNNANISAESLSQAGTKAFSGFLEQAQQLSEDVPTQLSYVESAMSAVNSYGFDPKYITVTDHGAIVEYEGKILDLDAMTFDGKEIEVSDDGSLQFVDQQTVELEGSLARLDKIRAKPTADLVDNATSAINDIWNAASKIDGQHFKTYIDTYETTYKQTVNKGSQDKSATGAIFNSRGKIPLNAAGAINGIVNRAMLTNIGWVGEAGAEAVMHMRNAGGAVIPLSNRRYVRPFARAVASEMGVGSSQVINKYYSVNGMTLAPGTDAAKALEALYDAIRLEEAV